MFMGQFKFEKLEKRDWFSDAVTNGFTSVGITQDMRNSLQPTVDHAVSLLPKGGAVPTQPSPIAAIPQATGFRYSGNLSPVMLVGIGAAIILLAYMVRE